jgi:hypothetical protein
MREALSNASDMIQPALILIIGNDYYIKIDQLFIKIENASLELGLAYVVGYYHVLNLQYPVPLKFVFVFLRPCLVCHLRSKILVWKIYKAIWLLDKSKNTTLER